ncbi:nitrogenase component 1 [Methanococcoides sp.]|uniref:nitrogenase component 1 n=1 Tax=Methanococcoides sp. TaxID=1966350 RepID=UPI00272E62FC|nr:nitrogenase component 1 [Methanococcoides sp.]
MIDEKTEIQTHTETAVPSIRDLNYPITTMGHARAYSMFPLHRQVLNNGKIRGQLAVARAIQGCIPLIHGPKGCAFQTKMCAMKPWDNHIPTPCTDFTEVEGIYGGNEKLEEGIVETYRKYKPELLMVISTCASDLTADDFPDIVEKAKRKVPCDIVYTTGTRTERRRRVGDQDALYSIADQLLEDCDKIENSVNLIAYAGFPPPRNHYSEFAEMLTESGINVNGIYFDSNTVSELKAIPKAELNINGGHFSWAELAEKKFGTDIMNLAVLMYNLEEIPFGIEGTLSLLRRVGDYFGLGGEVEAAVSSRAQEATLMADKYRKRMQGMPIAMQGISAPEAIMIRDLGMKCKVLTLRFSRERGNMSNSTLKWLEKRILRFLSMYQEEEPEVLIDPTIEEELRVFKKHDVKLVMPSAYAHPCRYAGSGFPVFVDRYTRYHGYHGHDSIGFRTTMDVGEDILWSMANGVGRNTLLSLVEYTDVWPRFNKHWENLAELFQELWYHEVPNELKV